MSGIRYSMMHVHMLTFIVNASNAVLKNIPGEHSVECGKGVLNLEK